MFDDNFDYKMCPHYSEDHDMGKTIPLCGKKDDYGICDGCRSDNGTMYRKLQMKPEDMALLLLFMAMTQSKEEPKVEKRNQMKDEPKRIYPLSCCMCKWFMFSSVSMCSICQKHSMVLKGRYERPCMNFEPKGKKENNNDPI